MPRHLRKFSYRQFLAGAFGGSKVGFWETASVLGAMVLRPPNTCKPHNSAACKNTQQEKDIGP